MGLVYIYVCVCLFFLLHILIWFCCLKKVGEYLLVKKFIVNIWLVPNIRNDDPHLSCPPQYKYATSSDPAQHIQGIYIHYIVACILEQIRSLQPAGIQSMMNFMMLNKDDAPLLNSISFQTYRYKME